MRKEKTLIGIDPDIHKSGVALLLGSQLELNNLSFFELFDYLQEKKASENLSVYVECGFLNGGNRHLKFGGSLALNSKIGERIGSNHETAKKIIEMCEYLKITHFKVKPTQSKINSKTFQSMTGSNIRTNQECRDAFMLVFGR